ncbi:uncharacterized protein BDW43DRAFT_273916 [Aspergillus alliaceus]|uniref:uncharacterized protein n=1 Tax=Petromyces alliaceus TaxID=209559 RepID=UPI0012A55DAF|nr:uncharacterized protein BDW43DRAFT_273916 [Aspergillus alliaceus]KAB8234356.1 hypothetical protein BDW43DRAFT_273916 [Aspergillus alliaceus]
MCSIHIRRSFPVTLFQAYFCARGKNAYAVGCLVIGCLGTISIMMISCSDKIVILHARTRPIRTISVKPTCLNQTRLVSWRFHYIMDENLNRHTRMTEAQMIF